MNKWKTRRTRGRKQNEGKTGSKRKMVIQGKHEKYKENKRRARRRIQGEQWEYEENEKGLYFDVTGKSPYLMRREMHFYTYVKKSCI